MKCHPTEDYTFSTANIRNCENHVISMQRRLDKAVADNDKGSIQEIFNLLTKRSNAVKLLATMRITQRNAGKYTAGVDGICIPKGETRENQNLIRHELMKEIDIERKPDNIRRIYIPKSNGKKKPLGIPTIRDRIVQEVLRITLDPIVEYHFHGQSYGFRPKRSCQDAIRHLHVKLSREACPRYVIEGDIKGCFDSIKHEHIIQTLRNWLVPKCGLEVIKQILKSDIFHDGQVYDSESGTPQGGLISPLLANVALTSLDYYCEQFGSRKSNPIVRYADDFVIVSRSELEAIEIKEQVAEHLKETSALILSEEKTKITHITKGFDFLGFNLMKQKTLTQGGKVKYVLRTQPQKEKVKDFLLDCKRMIKRNATLQQSSLISLLSPKIIGWGMYYRHVSLATRLHKADARLWEMLYRWGLRRHPKKSKRWVLDRYFTKVPNTKIWRFGERETNNFLPRIGKIVRKRFVKINNDYRVYDSCPKTIEYWNKREFLNAYDQIDSVKRKKLFSKQEGKCFHCKGSFNEDDILKQETHIHHVIPRTKGGTDNHSNLRLLHAECHREIHNHYQ